MEPLWTFVSGSNTIFISVAMFPSLQSPSRVRFIELKFRCYGVAFKPPELKTTAVTC